MSSKKMEEWNSYDLWQQGVGHYERLYVYSCPAEKAICLCSDAETAKWIAERLNLAAKLENEATIATVHTTHTVSSEDYTLVNADGTPTYTLPKIRYKDKLR